MERAVTICGIGRYSGAPDSVCVSFQIISRDKDYAEAMKLSALRQKKLTDALTEAGFTSKDCK